MVSDATEEFTRERSLSDNGWDAPPKGAGAVADPAVVRQLERDDDGDGDGDGEGNEEEVATGTGAETERPEGAADGLRQRKAVLAAS